MRTTAQGRRTQKQCLREAETILYKRESGAKRASVDSHRGRANRPTTTWKHVEIHPVEREGDHSNHAITAVRTQRDTVGASRRGERPIHGAYQGAPVETHPQHAGGAEAGPIVLRGGDTRTLQGALAAGSTLNASKNAEIESPALQEGAGRPKKDAEQHPQA